MRLGCWLPLACLLGIEVYASGFDGRGAWATGPLFLLPFALSLVAVVLGGVDAVREARSGGLQRNTLVCLGIAASPMLWLMVRRHFV